MSQVPKDLAEVEVFCWFAYWHLTREILLWHWDTFFLYEVQNQILHANTGRIIFILWLADSAVSKTDIIIITAVFVSGASAHLVF